jgi:hypothetical protein
VSFRLSILYVRVFLAVSNRDIDQNKNPNNITKNLIDDTAAENQWINGRLHAIEVSHTYFA